MTRTITRLPALAITFFTIIALALALPAAPVSSASPTACKVRNVTRGGNYGRLAIAVRRARQRDKLTVRGRCIGPTRIANKRLTIVGLWTRRSGPPTLRGNGRGPVLRILGDRVNVTVKQLVIEGRPGQVVDYHGAGVHLSGRLTLVNTKIRNFRTDGSGGGIYIDQGFVRLLGRTTIRDNRAGNGGGIHNKGARVIMAGTSSVQHNQARFGGGINTDGLFSLLKMTWRSSVHHNIAVYDGGGITGGRATVLKGFASVHANEAGRDGGGLAMHTAGALTMEGTSVVAGNMAKRYGGGIDAGGDSLTMRGASRVRGNTAGLNGGGIRNQSWVTLDGVVCAPNGGANVLNNSPDDCQPG